MQSDGQLVTDDPNLDPFGSRTIIMTPMTVDKVHDVLTEMVRKAGG
jgi:hypothetical protein